MQTEKPDLKKHISLCDALDRMLNQGVVLSGDVVVSVAGVDLLYIGLRGLICSMDALDTRPASLDSLNRMRMSDTNPLAARKDAS
jgi:hypothetical protein